MKPAKWIWVSLGIEAVLIAFVALACGLGPTGFAVAYNVGYGLVASVALPLWIMAKGKEGLATVGMKRIGGRGWLVLFSFVAFSMGGQLIPLFLAGERIRFDLLPLCIAPLVMTTFFEEFLLRGFLQTRIEQHWGWPFAIAFSGILFSLYHLGYPGFRSWEDLLLLFVVGIGFSAAYKLAGNNFWVAYFVNLPNAILTYLLKFHQFPKLTPQSSVYAVLTLVCIGVICLFYAKRVARQKGR